MKHQYIENALDILILIACITFAVWLLVWTISDYAIKEYLFYWAIFVVPATAFLLGDRLFRLLRMNDVDRASNTSLEIYKTVGRVVVGTVLFCGTVVVVAITYGWAF